MNCRRGNKNDSTSEAMTARGRRHGLSRILAWVCGVVLAVVLLCVLALCVATWWLTPERLTRIVNREASEAVNADVRAAGVRFSIWSTWPRLVVECDSLHVRSRTLDSVSPAVRQGLPPDAAFLLSTGRLRGGVNILKLFGGKIWARDVAVDSLRVNLLAVNDSVNNYDILSAGGHGHVPEFHIDGLRIGPGGEILYRSLLSQTRAAVSLDSASLTPAGGRNRYLLRLPGHITVSSGNMELFRDFPFELDGNVDVRFKPFGISTTDYKVSLGATKGRMSLNLDMGDTMRLNNFQYRLDGVTLRDILGFLPAGSAPALSRLNADLELDCSARLTSPYVFSSPWLPSARVDFMVPQGTVSYELENGARYAAEHVGLRGALVFNGRHPDESYVEIPEFSLDALGAHMRASGRITSLTTSPRVEARLRGNGDLARVARHVPQLRPYRPEGDVEFAAGITFRITGDTIYGSSLNLSAASRRAGFSAGGCRVEADGVSVRTGEEYADALTGETATHDIPLDVTLQARRLRLQAPADTLAVSMRGAEADVSVSRRRAGAVSRGIAVSLRGDEATVSAKGRRIEMRGVDMRLAASRLRRHVSAPAFSMPAAWTADSRSMAAVDHLPQFIRVPLSTGAREFMSGWRSAAGVKINRARVDLPGHEGALTASGLDLSASFDSVCLHGVELRCGQTRGKIAARVGNLRQFLGSPHPAPLRVDIHADLDTVQINQLARTFSGAGSPADSASKHTAMPDTMAMILPRNLYANIHLTADMTRYTNLKLYDLYSDITVRDGLASVDTLHIGSDFGHATLRLGYDTRHLQRMALTADLGILDVNIVNFFRNFEKLAVMFPEVRNLSGMIGARLRGRMLMFPSMYVNVPSVTAIADVNGWDLVLKQNSFIRRVTRKLQIHQSSPLHIHDINVRAAVHSNLLEVYPFEFEVSGYRLSLLGLNNFDGDLFYHIGVERWPLKIPFGLNVKGTYHNPELRLGGESWHDDYSTKIAAGVEDYNRVNVVKEARHYMGEFVNAAARYPGN